MNSIHDICKQYKIENYTINPDGSIDVNGDVFLDNKRLTELPLTFNKITGYFSCSDNKLTSLKGSPRWIGGWFDCNYNQLTSLEFSPDYVGGVFCCDRNQLTDNYCETEIGGDFYTDLEQNGLIINQYYEAINYNEWRKLYKRKLTLNELYTRHM
jgi:hypothetical protein